MNPVLQALADQVTASTTVEASAKKLIDGFNQRLQDAIAADIANGATAAQLANVQAEVDAMKASAADLSASVSANTPGGTPAPVGAKPAAAAKPPVKK